MASLNMSIEAAITPLDCSVDITSCIFIFNNPQLLLKGGKAFSVIKAYR